MSVGARTSEFARRHTGTPWGRCDCYVPPGWTRAIQARLPSDDRSAARSLFRRCRLRPALGKLEISTSLSSEEDYGKKLEAQAWVGLTRDSFPSVRICSLPDILAQAAEILRSPSQVWTVPLPGKLHCCAQVTLPQQPSKHKGTKTDHSDTYLITVEIHKNLSFKSRDHEGTSLSGLAGGSQVCPAALSPSPPAWGSDPWADSPSSSSHLTYYLFCFNKAFVPMALELGGRLRNV